MPGPNAAAQAAQAPGNVRLVSDPGVGDIVGAVAANRIEVQFPPGSAKLTPAATHNLDLAARLFRDANPVLMFVAGHSDNSGDEYSNLLISAARAQTVKTGLVARGIPANRLLLQAMGQSEPVVPNNQAAPQNRCVVVTWRLL